MEPSPHQGPGAAEEEAIGAPDDATGMTDTAEEGKVDPRVDVIGIPDAPGANMALDPAKIEREEEIHG